MPGTLPIPLGSPGVWLLFLFLVPFAFLLLFLSLSLVPNLFLFIVDGHHISAVVAVLD